MPEEPRSGPSQEELPGDPLVPRPATFHRFGEVEKREYLLLVSQGYRLGAAAQAIHFTPKTVRDARKGDPEFDLAVVEAEEDAAEPVEQKLYEAAKGGEPWAVKLWLANRSERRYQRGEDGRGASAGAVQVNLGVITTGTADDALRGLQERLEVRRDGVLEVGPGLAEAGVLDAPALPAGAGV